MPRQGTYQSYVPGIYTVLYYTIIHHIYILTSYEMSKMCCYSLQDSPKTQRKVKIDVVTIYATLSDSVVLDA